MALREIPSVVHASSLPGYLLYLAGAAQCNSQIDITVVLKFLEEYRSCRERFDSESQRTIEAHVLLGQLGKARTVMKMLASSTGLICSICQKELISNLEVVEMNCGDFFHPTCVDDYAYNKLPHIEPVCPRCAVPFSEEALKSLGPDVCRRYEEWRVHSAISSQSSNNPRICANCLQAECICHSSSRHMVCPVCCKLVPNPDRAIILKCIFCSSMIF